MSLPFSDSVSLYKVLALHAKKKRKLEGSFIGPQDCAVCVNIVMSLHCPEFFLSAYV